MGWMAGAVALLLFMAFSPVDLAYTRFTLFLFFVAIYSVLFFVNVMFLLMVTYYLLVVLWPNSRPSHWGLIGAVLFSASVPLWFMAFRAKFILNDWYALAIGAVAGGVLFVELRRRTCVADREPGKRED